MRAPRFLIAMLALGTVLGFGSGFRSMARWQYYKTHGGQSECGGWGRGYGYNDWQKPQQNVAPVQAPTIVEKVVEKAPAQVVTPVVTPTANPTVNIYVNGVPAQTQTQAQTPAVQVQNTASGDQQTR